MNTTSLSTTPHTSGSTIPYTRAELGEFSTVIENKLRTAQEDLDMARSSLVIGTSDTDFASHGLEDGRASLDREELFTQIARLEKFITELKRAQDRIRIGTYGICKVTGQRIPRERLLLVPHSMLCVAAKAA